MKYVFICSTISALLIMSWIHQARKEPPRIHGFHVVPISLVVPTTLEEVLLGCTTDFLRSLSLCNPLPAETLVVVKGFNPTNATHRAYFNALESSFVPQIPELHFFLLPEDPHKHYMAGYSRNYGAARAKYDLISFHDGDDLVLPHKFGVVYHLMAIQHPDLHYLANGFLQKRQDKVNGIVHLNISPPQNVLQLDPLTHQSQHVALAVNYTSFRDAYRTWREGHPGGFVHCCVLFSKSFITQNGHPTVRKKLWETIQFHDSMRRGQDSMFTTDVGVSDFNASYITSPLSVYRVRPNMASGSAHTKTCDTFHGWAFDSNQQ